MSKEKRWTQQVAGKSLRLGMNLTGSVEPLNFVNKFNLEAVNSFCAARAGQPTAAFDPWQGQFGLKLSLVGRFAGSP